MHTILQKKRGRWAVGYWRTEYQGIAGRAVARWVEIVVYVAEPKSSTDPDGDARQAAAAAAAFLNGGPFYDLRWGEEKADVPLNQEPARV